MSISLFRSSWRCRVPAPVRSGSLAALTAFLLTVGTTTPAQQPPDPAQTVQPQASQPAQAPEPTAATPAAPQASAQGEPETSQAGGITEEELKQLLVGKALYLRGGYLDNALAFDEHGRIIGHSPQGSYTLSAFQIDRVRLTKHKVELEGGRYGLHFVGQLAYEDPTKAVDRVRITPKKKIVKITIDREIVIKPKKKKEAGKQKQGVPFSLAQQAATPARGAVSGAPLAPELAEMSEADQLQASIDAAPAAERPADPRSVTTTTLPAHAKLVLKGALDQIFASGLDERMMAAMPGFWKLYYQAVAERADYRPRDPGILRQNTVDKKARLLSTFEPDSNEFAQANGVAGMALYHTVIGADGKPQEIAVGRPIGFGLDENAVVAIRKASFDPAMKDGKPVPVLLDLVVQFRIFSQRTAAHGEAEPAEKAASPTLPGPYSLSRP
jgi:outer membrane biosynthesis protein TonB